MLLGCEIGAQKSKSLTAASFSDDHAYCLIHTPPMMTMKTTIVSLFLVASIMVMMCHGWTGIPPRKTPPRSRPMPVQTTRESPPSPALVSRRSMLLDQAKLAASFSFLVATMPSNNDHNNPNTNNLLPAEENMTKEERKEFEKAVAAQKKKEQNERKMAADAKARLAVGRIGTI